MDLQSLKQLTAQVASDLIRPTAIEDDAKSFFRKDVFRKLAEKKLTCISLPKEYGGLGLSSEHYYSVIEELGKASPAMAIVVGVTNLIQGGLKQFGSKDQKSKYLTRLASGEWLGAFSLSESGSGSDARSLRCRAKKEKGGYVINGTKLWCSNAGYADFYLLMARTSEDKDKGISAFLISPDLSGFRVGKLEKKMGLRASSLGELIFENCFVPEERLLGAEGQGLEVALSQLDAGRISIGVVGVGITEEILRRGWPSLHEEGDKQSVSGYFARWQAIKSLVEKASALKDKGQKISTFASQIKLLGTDLAMEVTSYMSLLLGAEGVKVENEFERYFRDAKALQIVEGTNQVQQRVLAKALDELYV